MGVDPYADVEEISVREFFRRSREVLNAAGLHGRRFVINRLGVPAVIVGPAPPDIGPALAARKQGCGARVAEPPQAADLTPFERVVLQAVADRELHPLLNRSSREDAIEALRALGSMEGAGLTIRTPMGKYVVSDAGRAALGAPPGD